MGRAAVVFAGILAAAALAACSSAPPRADPASPPPGPRAVSCAWYTPTIVNGEADGQQVIVTATGPACRSQALIRWVSLKSSGKPWASTRLITGTIIAQMAKAGTVVRIYQSGWALATEKTAGYLADDFQAAGWAVQMPVAQPSLLGSRSPGRLGR